MLLLILGQRLAAAVQARDDCEVRLGAATEAALAGWNTTLLASVEATLAAAQPRGPFGIARQRPWWFEAVLCIMLALALIGAGVFIGEDSFVQPN